MKLIKKQSERISLIFKDLNADFIERAEGDVYFFCRQGDGIAELVIHAAQSTERVEMPVYVEATIPDLGTDPVAKFTPTLSLKKEIP